MTDSWTSANRGQDASLDAAGSRSRLSGRRNRGTRLKSLAVSQQPSDQRALERREGLGWDLAQEIIFSSQSRFMRVAYRILRNKEDAEDAMQEALLSAYIHFRAFEGRSAVTTWFTRIVMNASLMILRKRKSSHLEVFPDAPGEGQESWQERIPDSRRGPEALCAESETLHLVDAIVRQMSPLLHQAFALRHYEDASVAEGAKFLGIAQVNFKSRVFRARQHLAARVKHDLIAPLRGARFGRCILDEQI
ncbi:MAG TPA: sigma-70 family RNA polymerase sigma factor [Candidatus Eisenbacteria bacterium]|nr:sigma-70 family RNA polymerase sigma factor [Candidatus Eisenbacteria bacterium]